MTVAPLSSVTKEVVRDIQLLEQELRGEKEEVNNIEKHIGEIVEDPNILLMVARDGERIVGMATLYLLTKITKRVGSIEDVVVLQEYRGQKLGETLMTALIDEARKRDVVSVSLTSRQARVAAHALYAKLGFEKPETDYFRLVL